VKLAGALSLGVHLGSAASAGFQGDVAALEFPGEDDAKVLRGQACRATFGLMVFDAGVGRGVKGLRPACGLMRWCWLCIWLVGCMASLPAAVSCAGRKARAVVPPRQGSVADAHQSMV
jgi:hypothetical protein